MILKATWLPSRTVLATFLVITTVACSKSEEKPCLHDTLTCTGSKTAAYCENGMKVAISCEGESGCYKKDSIYECDQSMGKLGEPCLITKNGVGTESCDTEKVLSCEPGQDGKLPPYVGHWQQKRECLGHDKCKVHVKNTEKVAVCDKSIAKVGDACEEGKFACNEKKDALLECKQGKMARVQSCLGKMGCSVEKSPISERSEEGGLSGTETDRSVEAKVTCDHSVTKEGELCREENSFSCDETKSILNMCKNGVITVAKPCAKTGQCQIGYEGTRAVTVGCVMK